MVYLKLELAFRLLGKKRKDTCNDSCQDTNAWSFIKNEIDKAKERHSYKTAANYLTAANSLSHFWEHREWTFADIIHDEMGLFQRWLVERGLCMNTISCYMRSLRTLYNRAVECGLVEDTHPFSKVFTGKKYTRKRSAQEEDIHRLRNLYLGERSSLSLARDIFLFSFYAMGMPFVDIAYLRKDQVKGDKIHYARHKTGQPITVTLLPPMLQMMKRYESSGSDYVFPILSDAAPDVQHREYCRSLRRYNYSLHRLSEMLGLPRSLSSYVVRHSWASIAYRHHIDLGMIGKAMGHTKTSTTLLYIRSLFDPDLATANQELMEGLGL